MTHEPFLKLCGQAAFLPSLCGVNEALIANTSGANSWLAQSAVEIFQQPGVSFFTGFLYRIFHELILNLGQFLCVCVCRLLCPDVPTKSKLTAEQLAARPGVACQRELCRCAMSFFFLSIPKPTRIPHKKAHLFLQGFSNEKLTLWGKVFFWLAVHMLPMKGQRTFGSWLLHSRKHVGIGRSL